MARCTCCPYPLIAIPGVLSYAALLITWITAFSCNFFMITYKGDPLRVGLWTVEADTYTYQGGYLYESTTCNGYGWSDSVLSDELDGAMRTARAFSLIAGILGIIIFIMILVPSCVAFESASKNRYLMVLCGMCVFTGIATLLGLVALASDLCKNASECTLETAGTTAIVGGILWFLIAAFMLLALKKPRTLRRQDESLIVGGPAEVAPEQQPPMEETVIKTTENEDGSMTKIISKTITNADGSKTVTETTETIPSESA